MSAAVTRRTALRGSLAASLGLAAGVASAAVQGKFPSTGPVMGTEASTLSANDRRLVELADTMWAIHNAAEAHIVQHCGRETKESEADFSALLTGYDPVEDELAATPAASMQGVLAKARACQVPTLRDIDGGPVALSLADDLYRLHAAGRLAHA